MRRFLVPFVALVAMHEAAAGQIGQRTVVLPPVVPPPSVVAPYRFQPPPTGPTSPLDEQMALSYRNQLRSQLRDDQLRSIAPGAPGIPVPPDVTVFDPGRAALDAQRLQETGRELRRMDQYLNPANVPHPEQLAPRVSPGPVPSRDPLLGPLRGGGHPQPTPAEIEQRLKERGDKAPEQRADGTAPVYDFFGEPIQ